MTNKPYNTSYLNNKNPKNSPQKKKNWKPLIYTFLGTFIVFFFVFTVLLPILSPQVVIPALSNEHSMSSVSSNDFKGRIDPRLNEIEQEENAGPPKLKMESPNSGNLSQQQPMSDRQNPDVTANSDAKANKNSSIYSEEPGEPQGSVPGEDDDSGYNSNIGTPENPDSADNTAVSHKKPPKLATSANIPPRPQASSQYSAETQKSSSMAKVVLGSYSTPMQARLVSDTLIEMDLNVTPFIKEKNGRYVLQVGSFSDPAKAESLVRELKSKSFDAKVVYD